MDRVVLGGSADPKESDTKPQPNIRNKIIDGNSCLVPPLKFCKSVKEAKDWVGLRPGRCQVRLEKQTMTTKKGESLHVNTHVM